MPANQSLGVRATRRLDTAIREIDVSTGPLVLTKPSGETITVQGGERETFDPPLAGMLAYAPDGSRYHVTYETDPAGHEESRRQPGTGRKRTSSRKRSSAKRTIAAKAKSTRTSASKSKTKAKAKSKGLTRKKG